MMTMMTRGMVIMTMKKTRTIHHHSNHYTYDIGNNESGSDTSRSTHICCEDRVPFPNTQ